MFDYYRVAAQNHFLADGFKNISSLSLDLQAGPQKSEFCTTEIYFILFPEIHLLWCTLEWNSILLWSEIFITINQNMQIFAKKYFYNGNHISSLSIDQSESLFRNEWAFPQTIFFLSSYCEKELQYFDLSGVLHQQHKVKLGGPEIHFFR